MFNVVLCLCLFLAVINGAKILGVFMTPSFSHQQVFQPVWKELSLRGHQVIVYTPSPLNEKSLTNLTEYDLNFSYEVFRNYSNFEDTDSAPNDELMQILLACVKASEAQLNHPFLQDLLKNVNKDTYDLLIVEYFWQPYYALKEIYKVPMVGLLSFPLSITTADVVGLEKHPVVDPEFLLDFSFAKNFKQRLQSWLFNWAYRVFFQYKVTPIFDDQIRKYFGNDMKSATQLTNEVELVIGSSNFALDNLKARNGKYVAVSSLHVQPIQPLPKDLGEYLDKLKTDVIYFSLGTNVKSSKIAKNVMDTIIKVLGSLPYTILWKSDLVNLPKNIHKNFYIRKWYPQQDLLGHEKVKLFITQGGCQSIDEAMDRGVPMLIMPVFGDQPANADKCVNKGIAEMVNIYDFTEEEFRIKLSMLLTTSSYKSNIIQQGKIVRDQPLPAVDTAIFWIEYVIRHKGASHLQPATLTLPFYQYHLLDVYLFVAFVLYLFIYISKKVIFGVLKLFKLNTKQKIA
ncbi:UDP-glucuronosyltransferase 1-5-like [Sitophilus oryzae]|uniref:UDP-glucuronosyltransferase n=1 Tax=Sitophilus oryzae TaxID=7048 RepID=A0A6J2YIC3_SITOR|nr:UDP-glucuronosyltransferase 1-5-like [Sitophilus oryzae]